MRGITVYLLTAAALVLMGRPASAAVVIGDKAPGLLIREWVRGEPVDLVKNAEKKLHLVEFWATWCPPCKASVPMLTEYQKKFAKDLVIIGVTDPDPYQNSPTQIRQFVKAQGARMDYHVAMDDSGKTSRTYMDTSEPAGIPYAVLVGRDGRVAWQGSPLDPAMEQVITDMIAGKYDLESAAKSAQVQKEVDKLFQQIDTAFQLQKMDEVWKNVVEVMTLDPTNDLGLQLLGGMYVNEPDYRDAFLGWVRSHIDAHRSDPLVLSVLALTLCRIDDYALRTPELAMEAAKAAYDATGGKDRLANEIYARTLYQIGALDKAIEFQLRAVEASTPDERAEAEGILAYYRKCKTLNGSGA